jgi:hypothetical protein
MSLIDLLTKQNEIEIYNLFEKAYQQGADDFRNQTNTSTKPFIDKLVLEFEEIMK